MKTNRKNLISCDYVFESNNFYLKNVDNNIKQKNDNKFDKKDMNKNKKSYTNKDNTLIYNNFLKDSFQLSLNVDNEFSSKNDFEIFSDDEFSFIDIKKLKDNLNFNNNIFNLKYI